MRPAARLSTGIPRAFIQLVSGVPWVVIALGFMPRNRIARAASVIDGEFFGRVKGSYSTSVPTVTLPRWPRLFLTARWQPEGGWYVWLVGGDDGHLRETIARVHPIVNGCDSLSSGNGSID